MQERLNWTVSKTVVAQVTVGSNPTLSAIFCNDEKTPFYLLPHYCYNNRQFHHGVW